MRKEESKTREHSGMNRWNHSGYASHPCQVEDLPSCPWMEKARNGSILRHMRMEREPSTPRRSVGFPPRGEEDVLDGREHDQGMHVGNDAAMDPMLPVHPRHDANLPSTQQCRIGLGSSVTHTHIVLSSNHTSLRCNDVRRLSLVTTWQHRRARVLRKRFVARSLAAWKRTHLARVVRWTAATCTSMDVVAGVQHVLREGRTGARIASCARL